jgi:hypothetical protein
VKASDLFYNLSVYYVYKIMYNIDNLILRWKWTFFQ